MQPYYSPVRKTLECSGENVWAPKITSHGDPHDVSTAGVCHDASLHDSPTSSRGPRGDKWIKGSSMPHLSSASDVHPTHLRANTTLVSVWAQPAEATAAPPSMRTIVSLPPSSRHQQPCVSSYVMEPSAILSPRAVQELPKADAVRSGESNARTPTSSGRRKVHRPATAGAARPNPERGPNVGSDRGVLGAKDRSGMRIISLKPPRFVPEQPQSRSSSPEQRSVSPDANNTTAAGVGSMTQGSGSASVIKHTHNGPTHAVDNIQLYISGTTPRSSRLPAEDTSGYHDSARRRSPDVSPGGSGGAKSWHGSPRHPRGRSPRGMRVGGLMELSQRSGSPGKRDGEDRPIWVKCLLHRRMPDRPNLVVDATPLSPKLAEHDPSSPTLLPEDWQDEMHRKVEDEATKVRHALQQRGSTDNKYRKHGRSYSAEVGPNLAETGVIEYRHRHITKTTPLWRNALLMHASSPPGSHPNARPQSACIDKNCHNPTIIPIGEPTSPTFPMSPLEKGESTWGDQVSVALMKEDGDVRECVHWGDRVGGGSFVAPPSTPSHAAEHYQQQRHRATPAHVATLRPHTAEATIVPFRHKRKKPAGSTQQLAVGLALARPTSSFTLGGDAFVINGKPTVVHHHPQSSSACNSGEVHGAEGARSPLFSGKRDRPMSREKMARGCAVVDVLRRPLTATNPRDRRCQVKLRVLIQSSIAVEGQCASSKCGDARVVMPIDKLVMSPAHAVKAKN